METVAGYSFRPADLRVAARRPGISAFMRIRNGADFLEAAIRSHIDAFDEIVAVYNQCTDKTPDILARLAQEYGPKLKVFHYADRVYPPGSKEHATEPADSPHSLVNYYNFALAQTGCAIATKLDDDHLAMGTRMRILADEARASTDLDRVMHCFSGLNLARDAADALRLPAADLLCGNGDHWFFRVVPHTFFVHDRRFEKLAHPGLRRRFTGFAYWHLKYLKPGSGFANYELERNRDSRYVGRLMRISKSPLIGLKEARTCIRPSLRNRLLAPISDKQALLRDRANAFAASFPQATVVDALDATSPQWDRWLTAVT